MQTFLLSLILLVQALCSQIAMRDLAVQPCNRDQRMQFRLVFNLQTTISSDDLIKIVSPVNLTSISAIQLLELQSECDPHPKILNANLQTADMLTMYLNFTDQMNNPYSLSAGFTYNLTFQANLSSPTTETPRFVGPLKIYSVSDTSSKAIEYDSNPSFGFFYIGADVGLLSTLTLMTIAGNATYAGFSHPVDIVFNPLITIPSTARVIGRFLNTNYTFDNCFPLNDTGYSFFPSRYSVKIENSQFTILINQTLIGSSVATYKIRCNVRNPYTTGQSTSLQLTTAFGGMENYVESKTITTTLVTSSSTNAYTTPISWNPSLHSVKLGWGVVASETTSLDVLAIFKDANANEKWYQTVKISFSPTQTLSIQNYTIVFYTVSDSAFLVLKNSLQHTMPQFDTLYPVSCDVTSQVGMITCKGVGVLQAGTQYYLAFRYNLGSTATATSANFGKIDVYTQTNPQYLIVQTGAKTLKTTTIVTNQALSTTLQNIAYSKSTTGTTTFNYIHAGATTNLYLKFNYFTNTIINIATTNPYNKGLEFYTSYSLPTAISPTCGITGLSSTDISFSSCEVTNIANSYTALRFRIGQLLNTGNVGTIFGSSIGPGEVYFTNTVFDSSKLSDLSYIGENIYDFYARWISYSSIGSTISLLGSQFFFNSLVYQAGILQGLSITPAFMTTANTGSSFPSLIRVYGNFTSTEITNSVSLMIFFNGLTALNPNNPCFGNVKLTCKMRDGSIDNTQTDNLPDYSSSGHVIVTFDTGFNTTPFNFYIPVYNNVSVSNLGFFAVLARDSGNSLFTADGIYKTTYSKRFWNQSFSSAPTLTIGTASTSLATLNLASIYSLGSVINTSITTGFQLSSGSKGGSHYSICTSYNFYSNGLSSTLATSTISSSVNTCANMTYNYLGANVYCRICPIHDTLTGNINLNNFKLSVLSGIDAGNFTIQTSLDNGYLNFSVFDAKSSNMNATIIQFYELYAPGLMITTAGQRIIARAIFTVDVPKQSYLKFVSNTTIDITPSTTLTSCYVNMAWKTCTVSQSDTSSISIYITSTDNSNYVAGILYEFSFFVDLTSVTTASNISYNASVIVMGTSMLVPQQISNTSKVLREYAVYNNTFQLTNLSYIFGNTQATTTISVAIDLPSAFPLLKDRYLVCNFGTIARFNIDSNTIYHNQIKSQGTTSLLFKNCDSKNLTQVTATARNYVSTPVLSITNLKILSMVAPPTFTCSLYETNGVVLATSQPLYFPVIPSARQFLASDINLYAQFAVAGSVCNLTLMAIFRYNDVAATDSIYVYFPSYYNPRLGYDPLNCGIMNFRIKCEMIQDYVLRITAFPGTIAKLTRMFIYITGVLFPSVPSANTEYFFIAYDNDNDPSVIVQSGYVPPIYNVAYPNYLRAGFSVGMALDNIISTFYFTIDTSVINPSLVTSGATIFIDFPNLFASVFALDATSKIIITNTASGNTLSNAPTLLGGRIALRILQNFERTGAYQISFTNIMTPTSIICSFPMPSLAILSSNNFDLLYMSSINTIDSSYLSFLDSTGSSFVIKSLSWYNSKGLPITNLTVYDGAYSEIISLGTNDGSLLQTTISLVEKTGNFLSLPSTLSVASGIRFLSFRIATIPGLIPGSYYKLTYQLTNTISTIYKNPPSLDIYLSTQQITLIPANFSLPSGGFSLPIVWDLSLFNGIPRDDVTITASVLESVSGLFFVQSGSSITLTPSNFVGSFVFAVFSNVTSGNSLSVTYTLSGTNKGTYKLSSSIAFVQITPAITSTPTISSFTVLTPTSPVSQSFQITASQSINLYYFNVRTENYLPTDCNVILSLASIPPKYSLSDATQSQYGLIKLETPKVSSTFTISNLLSNTQYTVQFCPYNQGALFGTTFTSTYTTLDNMQQVYQLTFIFTNTLTDYQLASICCYFAQQTLLPTINVLSTDRSISCNDLSTTNAINKNVARFFTISAYGDKTSAEVNNSVTNTLFWTIGNLSNPNSYYYQSFMAFLSSIGLGNQYSNSSISIGSTSTIVSFVGSAVVVLDRDSFSIQGVFTNQDSTIYAVLYRGGQSPPTQSQIKKGYDTTGRYYYSTLTVTSLASTGANITFTGLEPQLKYTISYFAEAGTIVGYIRETNVETVNGTTLAYTLDSPLETSVGVFVFVIGIVAYIMM